MSFAHITGSTVDQERATPPTEGVRQDTGQTVSGIQPSDLTLLAACGWKPVVNTARPADTAQNTSDRSLVVTAGVPTETWTVRPWTQAELDSNTANANRATVEASFLTFIDGADTAIANMQAIQNDPAPTFSTLAQALAQVTALQNRVKLIASTEEAHIRKTVALARYVSNHLDSLDNT